MTLQETIEFWEEVLTTGELGGWVEAETTIKLSIEALKLVQRLRTDGGFLSPRPLPGETKD